MKFLGRVLGGISKLKLLWKRWNIRSFMLASFFIQLILILIAPFRKRTSNALIIASTWLCYLLADWVAAQAVGLITRATEVSDAEDELFSLWAQFLLLHLGGPDTITALAVEDTALWLRTALHLGTQVFSALGIFVRSVERSRLWAPMVLMFFAGIIKYLERVMSLFHGRLEEFDEDPDPYLEQLRAYENKGRLSDVEMVRAAYSLYLSYKRLFADLTVRYSVREASRSFVLKRTPQEAYRMVAIELNLMYDAIYTKASIIHKTSWRILRHAVLLLELASLVVWCGFINKRGYSDRDIRITNALVIGAIATEGLAHLAFQISDWNIGHLKDESRIRSWLCRALRIAYREAALCIFPSMWSRWSESINIYLLRQRLHQPHLFGKGKGLLKLQLLILKHHAVIKKPFTSELWDFIFNVQTKYPSETSREYKLCSGETVELDVLVARALPLDILDYNEILMSWVKHSFSHYDLNPRYDPHLPYVHDDSPFWSSCVYGGFDAFGQQRTPRTYDLHLEIFTTIRGYLLYLMIFQPNMMFGAAGKEYVLEVQQQLQTNADTGPGQSGHRCVNCENKAEARHTDGSTKLGSFTSELGEDVRIRARSQMKEILKCLCHHISNEGEKWEVMARLWVRLLCYTAVRCRTDVHAAQLKQGGEFLSFVWLLMVHLGIGTISIGLV